MDALREFVGREREAGRIALWRSQIAEPLKQAKGLQDGRVDAYTDAMVASFDLSEGRSARERAFGHDAGRQTPSPPGVADVLAELAKRAAHGEGGSMRRRHNGNIAFR